MQEILVAHFLPPNAAKNEGFDHGKPYTFVHEGQEIKLCCKDCLADFKKEPSKYLSKLNAPK